MRAPPHPPPQYITAQRRIASPTAPPSTLNLNTCRRRGESSRCGALCIPSCQSLLPSSSLRYSCPCLPLSSLSSILSTSSLLFPYSCTSPLTFYHFSSLSTSSSFILFHSFMQLLLPSFMQLLLPSSLSMSSHSLDCVMFITLWHSLMLLPYLFYLSSYS